MDPNYLYHFKTRTTSNPRRSKIARGNKSMHWVWVCNSCWLANANCLCTQLALADAGAILIASVWTHQTSKSSPSQNRKNVENGSYPPNDTYNFSLFREKWQNGRELNSHWGFVQQSKKSQKISNQFCFRTNAKNFAWSFLSVALSEEKWILALTVI